MKFRGETVLLYGLREGEQGRKLQAVLVRMGVKIRIVEEDQRKELLGSLFKLPGFEPASQSVPSTEEQETEIVEMTEPVMVLNGFSNSRLGELLTALKKANVPRIDLKAMLTQNNVNWTFEALYQELKEENEQMAAYRESAGKQ